MRILRYEFKYYIDEEMYQRVMDTISHYLAPDPYAVALPNYTYPVNSLYLDSPSKRYYEEKMAGIKNRHKIRMRCYTPDFYSSDKYFIEVKKRDQSYIDKIRIKMPAQDYTTYMRNDFFTCPDTYLNGDPDNRAIMEEILYHCNRHILTPTVFIKYEREAYVANNEDLVRVTFDRYVMSQRFYSHLSKHLLDWSSVFPGKIIFEIKVRNFLPFWLHNLVKKFGFFYESISKYCNGIDSSELLYF